MEEEGRRSRWSLGPRRGGAGGAKQNVFFFCLGCSFPFVWRLGEKEYRMPHSDGASSSGVGKGYSLISPSLP